MTHSLGSLLVAAQVHVASGVSTTVAERAAQPFDFVFQKHSGYQCLSVGISHHGQCFLTGASFHIPEPVIGGTVLGAVVSLGVEPRDPSWMPTQFLPPQCGNLLMLEAFFDGVQDLLAEITGHLPWQPSQLLHIMVDFCDLLSC